MTLLYTDPCFLNHDTGRDHPECADRLRRIVDHLNSTGLVGHCKRPEWSPITLPRLARVHDLAYADAVKRFAEAGGGRIESDTVICRASYDIALWAAGAVVDAVQCVVRGVDQQALCLIRPPGHHALQRGPMGFCLFNNIACGARVAIDELDLNRVLVIDWDVHHGNGTQDTFWRDGQVSFLSIHRWPFYPGSGAANETGSGPGHGHIVNLPVEYGTPRREYLARFATELNALASRVRPELVLISAGFDAHRMDPIGSLDLENEDFDALTNIVLDVADQYAGGRVVSVLEGGYDIDVLPYSVEAHLRALLARQSTRAK